MRTLRDAGAPAIAHLALLLEKNIERFTPSPYLTFSVHLDGNEAHHDKAVDQKGTFAKAVAAIKKTKKLGFRVNINCTLFDGADAAEMADFFTFASRDLGAALQDRTYTRIQGL